MKYNSLILKKNISNQRIAMAYFRWILLAFSLLSPSLIAQETKLDSLQAVYHTTENKKQKILTLIQIIDHYAQINPDTALRLAQKALSISEGYNFEPGKAQALNKLGVINFYIGNYPESFNYYQKSLAISEKLDDKKSLTSNLNLIGMLFIKQKEYSKARKYLEKCLNILEGLGDSEELTKVHNNLGNLFFYQNQFDKALQYYIQCTIISKNLHLKIAEGVGLNNSGLCLIGMKKYQEGLVYLFKSKDIFTKINFVKRIGENDRWIAEAYLKMNDYPQAKKFATSSLRIAQKIKDLPMVNESAKILFEVYKQEKDFQQALIYHELFKQSEDSLFNVEKTRIINDLDSKAELEKKDMEITNQKAINQVQKKINYLILIGLLVPLIMSYLLYRISRKERKAKKILEQQNIQIQQQKDEIHLQTQTLRELNASKDKLFAILGHDLRAPISLLQSSLGLLQKQTMTPEEFMGFSDDLKRKVDQVYFTLHNLLYWANSQMQGFTTRPTQFDFKKLVDENLELFYETAQAKQISLQNEIADEVSVLADRDHVNLVVRNLINNALKFTNEQGQVTISANLRHDFWCLAVRDTGLGISTEDQEKLFNFNLHFSKTGSRGEKGTGLGLILCKEMIERNQGQIWVESELNKGTTFYFTLPTGN